MCTPRSRCRPCRTRTSLMRMRCMSALRWRAARATTRRRQRMLESCLELRRGIGNPVDIAATLSTLSVVRLHVGDAVRAREGEEEALAIFRQQGCRIGEAIVLLQLGEICLHTGNDEEARGYFEQSLAIARDVKYQEIESDCERMLGQLALECGDLPAAASGSNARSRSATKRGTSAARPRPSGGSARRTSPVANRLRAPEARRSTAGVPVLRDECGSAGVPRGPRPPCAFSRIPRRGGASLRSGGGNPRAARSAARPARRPALEGRRRGDAAALGDAAFDAAWAEGRKWELKAAIRRALAPATPRQFQPDRRGRQCPHDASVYTRTVSVTMTTSRLGCNALVSHDAAFAVSGTHRAHLPATRARQTFGGRLRRRSSAISGPNRQVTPMITQAVSATCDMPQPA